MTAATPSAEQGETLYRRCPDCGSSGVNSVYDATELFERMTGGYGTACETCEGERFIPVVAPNQDGGAVRDEGMPFGCLWCGQPVEDDADYCSPSCKRISGESVPVRLTVQDCVAGGGEQMEPRITVNYSIRDAARIVRALRTEAKDHESQGVGQPTIYRALAVDLERRIIATGIDVAKMEAEAEQSFAAWIMGNARSALAASAPTEGTGT